jgi:GxxExxY protein
MRGIQVPGDEKEMEINRISGQIVDAAIKVHSAVGPGLLESAYEACLYYELERRGLPVQREVALPLVYDGVWLDIGYRIDLLVADSVIVEIKAIAALLPIHEAQLLSYLRLSGHGLGLLLNFHVAHMRDGIKRMVNRL